MRLNCLCHALAIHYTLVILSISVLKMTLKQEEMKTKTTKRKLSGLYYLPCSFLSPILFSKKGFPYVLKQNSFHYFALPKTLFPHSKNINCLTCYGYNENSIGKTDRNLLTRLHEYGSHDNQPKHKHLLKCEHFIDILN